MKKIRMNKKSNMTRSKLGQVSLEFLTTYGWAFMVALIAIGALAYFGVLNPSKYTPKRCSFGSEISCNDFRLANNGGTSSQGNNVTLRLTNGIGSSVTISSFNINDTASTKYSCAPVLGSTTWNDGAVRDFTCQADSGVFIKGAKQKVAVTIAYYDPVSGASYSHVINGEVYDQVQ